MSPDPVSWPIYILILLIVMVSNGLVSAALNALDSVDRNKLNEIEEDDPNNKRAELVHSYIKKPSRYDYPDTLFM